MLLPKSSRFKLYAGVWDLRGVRFETAIAAGSEAAEDNFNPQRRKETRTSSWPTASRAGTPMLAFRNSFITRLCMA